MKPSPAAMPSEPPMKAKSCTMTTARAPPIVPRAIVTVSFAPVALRAAASRSG